jgi:Homing endonuclease associated repeat
MSTLSAVDLLCHGFAALSDDEQEEALVRLRDIELTRLASAETESAAYLRALRRVADLNAGELSPDLYKRTRAVLQCEGEELPPLSAVIRYYTSWALAKRAAGLAELTTADVVELRFRRQLVGLNPHYQEEELAAALKRCSEAVGRAPLVSEYETWRRKELTLQRTRGNHPRVPCPESFRRRFGTWEKALWAHGFTAADLQWRLESPERSAERVKVWRYTDDSLAAALKTCARTLGRVPRVEDYARWRRQARKDGSDVPTDSPFRRRFGTWERALKHFGFSDAEIAARFVDGRERTDVYRT